MVVTAKCGRATLLLVLLALVQNVWADVRATLDRSTVYDGETVTLAIEVNGRDASGEPDLSPLSKHFEVLGTSNSQRIQIINGQRSDIRQWQVELAPKQSGTLEIPSLNIGQAKTKSITLKVEEQPAADVASSDRPVFVRTEARTGTMDVYVQQQILYVVRLYYRVPLLEGGFQDPQPADAVVERLGEDRSFKSTVNGEDYQVVERHYAIFPEKSGDLTLPAVTFTGRAASNTSRRSSSMSVDPMMQRFFGGMLGDPGKRFRVRSEPLTLDVQPRPASYNGTHWLPSQELMLQDSWQGQPPEIHVGEPVTRMITLQAKGLESSQLPVLDFPSAQGLRVYPEQPVSENHTDGDWIYGVSKQTLAYVPSTAGIVTLPAVRVDWWDTLKHEQRTTELPALEITVLPATSGAPTTPTPSVPDITPAAAASNSEPPPSVTGDWRNRLTPFRIGLLSGVVLLLLIAVLWWRLRRRDTQQPSRASRRELRNALKSACDVNNPHAAARALLDWAAVEWLQPPRNLGALAQRLASGSEEVRRLDHVLYADGAGDWRGEALWKALQAGLSVKRKRAGTESEGLAPLYPYRSAT